MPSQTETDISNGIIKAVLALALAGGALIFMVWRMVTIPPQMPYGGWPDQRYTTGADSADTPSRHNWHP
jgi:hypothetical protein